jgi:4-alpha-glucanotransferase
MMLDELRRTAKARGIATRFTDAGGRRYQVSAATLGAVLDAMGPPAEPTPWPAVVVTRTGRREKWRPPAGEPVELVLESGEQRPLPPRLPGDLEPGWHRVVGRTGATTLVVAPDRCHLPPLLAGGGRAWGWAAQLYAVRSRDSWGIGDLGDLSSLLAATAPLGAGFALLNPLHAASPDEPSPYNPSSRVFRNPLYLRVEAIPELAGLDPEQRARVAELAGLGRDLLDRHRIDRPATYRLKDEALRLAHGALPRLPGRRSGLAAYRAANGNLDRYATFCALQHVHGRDWRAWPAAYRHPARAEVAAFGQEHRDEVDYHAWLQWLLDEQLAAVASATRVDGHHATPVDSPHATPVDSLHARSAGRLRSPTGGPGAGPGGFGAGPGGFGASPGGYGASPGGVGVAVGAELGVLNDLAIGFAPDGFDAWSFQDDLASGVTVGAPPDPLGPRGQDWGLPAFVPDRLAEVAYEPFAQTIRAGMAHAAGLRIDHVMGLFRLFWIPEGAEPAQGTYVRYPVDDLLGILALESLRAGALVVGEDLGTVEARVRRRLAREQVLSYRLAWFEETGGGRRRPAADYPRLALAAATTHDLPTVAGFFSGHDFDHLCDIGVVPAGDRPAAAAERDVEVESLCQLLEAEGVLAPGVRDQAALVAAIHAFLARTPAMLVAATLEDAIGATDRPNVPGTIDERPNWALPLPVTVEELATHPAVERLARLLDQVRQA